MEAEEAVRNMLRTERESLARKHIFRQASAKSLAPSDDTSSGPTWSEHTQKLMLEAAAAEADDGGFETAHAEEDVVASMLRLPAASARAQLIREVSAAALLPEGEAFAYEEEVVAVAPSAVDAQKWDALVRRVGDLEESNAALRATVARLAAIFDARGDQLADESADQPADQSAAPQRVGAADRHLAASRAGLAASRAATAANSEANDALPSCGVDLRAAVAQRAAEPHRTPVAINGSRRPVLASEPPSAAAPTIPLPTPPPALNAAPAAPGPLATPPPPAFAAAHAVVASANERAQSAAVNGDGRAAPLSDVVLGAAIAASRSAADDRRTKGMERAAALDVERAHGAIAASRSAAEDRLAKGDRMERAAERAHAAESPESGSDPTSMAVGVWWSAHFGAGSTDVVPFDRMRIAAEAELGALSSVDVQLLRLELSDERGKLTKTALKRLISGSHDGTAGHETIGNALRALLQAARAQLDRQVEVRMKQAASRSSRGGGAGGAMSPLGSASKSASKSASRPLASQRIMQSPVERRVRLEFDGS